LAVIIYITIAIATPWAGNSVSVSSINKIVYFIFGLLFFSLIEYLMHRFLYHSRPNYKDERYWQYKVHGVHHDFPTDNGLLALPIPLAILLGGVFFVYFI
jgi:sterol desaturase/sphingolipid hydroxylase (fatty acid hydroxylase superfamily)|tara:strand:+ start:291 stop:590 length:300 start_codon:yes stop_codon:yes gene_type:complete